MLDRLPVEIFDYILCFVSESDKNSHKLTNSWGYVGAFRDTHSLSETMKLYFLLQATSKEFRITDDQCKYLLQQRFQIIVKAIPTEYALSILSKMGVVYTYQKLIRQLMNRITARAMLEMHTAIQQDNLRIFNKLCLHFPHFLTDHIVIASGNGFWYNNTLILPKLAPQTSLRVGHRWETVFHSAKNVERSETQTVIELIKSHSKRNQKIGKLCGLANDVRRLRPRPKI